MSDRQNFTKAQRDSAFEQNARWLRYRNVSGVLIATAFESLRQEGKIYHCENCLFCHTDRKYFDVDHLVPDKSFKDAGNHADAREAINMVILCKSNERGDLGCNQSKGALYYVPRYRGLAFTHPDDDMNCFPIHERPFAWSL